MTARFNLPPQGALQPNDDQHDPLPYYYKPVVGALYRRRIECGLELLSPPYESILELGYGSGLLMPTLAQIGGRIAGVDICSDPARVGAALEKLGVKASLKQGDICSMDYPGDSFDLVVAFSIFEHVADPVPALKAIRRILRPGGHLLVGMPRVDKFMARLFPLIGYRVIEEHHVSNHRDFAVHATRLFDPAGFKTMPSFVPSWAALYFNMLFRKPAV